MAAFRGNSSHPSHIPTWARATHPGEPFMHIIRKEAWMTHMASTLMSWKTKLRREKSHLQKLSTTCRFRVHLFSPHFAVVSEVVPQLCPLPAGLAGGKWNTEPSCFLLWDEEEWNALQVKVKREKPQKGRSGSGGATQELEGRCWQMGIKKWGSRTLSELLERSEWVSQSSLWRKGHIQLLFHFKC